MDHVWRSTRKFIYKRILHADDTPHRIALGVALATFIAFTPTMGAQTIIAISLAAIFRANKAVCLPFVWITNPFTFGPIYWGCWRIGSLLTSSPTAADEAALASLLGYSEGGQGFVHGLFSYNFWAGMLRVMVDFGVELWVGCGFVGLVTAVPLYFATKWTVAAYRAKRQALMIRRHEWRKRRAEARSQRTAKKIAAAGKTA